MKQLEKIQAVSVMRVMAMLMIISFHSLCFYTHRWWSFGGIYIPTWDKMATLLDAIDLPMFVFISGFLFGHLYIKGKYRKWQPFIQSKVNRLLVPYLIWGVFLIITMPLLHEWFYMLTGISHLWFLLMLFEIFIIIIPFAHFLCLKATKLQAAIITLSSYILFLAYHEFTNHHSFLCIHITLFYLPMFLIGVFFARFKIHYYLPNKLTLILLIMSLSTLTFYSYTIFPLPFYANNIILRVLGYTIVISLFSLLCNRSFNDNFYKAVTYFDKLSMGIYIFNQICINILLLIPGSVMFFNQHYYIGPAIILTVGFFIPWLLSYIFNNVKFLKWSIGGSL